MPGLVIANFGNNLIIETAAGETLSCVARRKLGLLVCGDRIGWQRSEDNDCIVVQREERVTELARPDKQGRKKVIAANVEQMLIITSPKPAFNPGLIDRYLVAAETLHIQPVIVLNKIDLLDSAEEQSIQQQLDIYRATGYPVITTSVKTIHGLEKLQLQLRNHTSIFVGQSGVGKSSLINAILPDAKARTGDISQASGKGTHTTTTAWLYHLPDGNGAVIDSPGVREFGLWQIDPQTAAAGFREFREFAEHCRFRNCLHKGEPGCAVKAAQQEGKIASQRLESYHRILASLEENNGQDIR